MNRTAEEFHAEAKAFLQAALKKGEKMNNLENVRRSVVEGEPKRESVVDDGPFQAILTHYIGPTNFKGGRVKAVSGSGLSVTLPYQHELSIGGNHAAACKALVDKLNWGGRWIGGGTDKGQAFVMVEHE